MTVVPIIPTLWREPFDADGWTLELKHEGFRGIADTVNGRMLSKRGNRMKRFDGLLAALPAGCIFDGEIAAIDQYGRPRFRALLFDRGPPAYVVFDALQAGGEDLRGRPLRERKAVLAQFARGARGGSRSRTRSLARAVGCTSSSSVPVSRCVCWPPQAGQCIGTASLAARRTPRGDNLAVQHAIGRATEAAPTRSDMN